MKISVSSYSFSQYIRAGKLTQLTAIDKAKEMGFDAIEFIDIDGAGNLDLQKENAAKLKARADELGMVINAYTIGANLAGLTEEARAAEVERLKGQLDVAKILGAGVMRHEVCYSLGKTCFTRSFDLMLPYLADSARKVTEYGATLGIKTCSENHGYIAQDSDRMERLFNAVNHDNYGLLVDMGNFTCVDENHALAVSRVAPYAVHAHAKDMKISKGAPYGCCQSMTRGGNYFCGTAIGEGDVPVKQCLNILKRAGYEGYLSIEFEGHGDCVDGIARGFANLKNMLAELGWN